VSGVTATPTFCPQAQRRYVLIAAILASALGFIDGSVVSIAIPAMRTSLAASFGEAQWISNAYMLTLSSFLLVGGAAGDRFGLRRVFAFGIALFVGASMLCALAPSAGLLIAARALQGIGAAIMVPGSLAIISKAFPKDERGKAIGTWAAASAITTAAGPILGGMLLSWGSAEIWRLIFAINLPLGGVALYLLMAKVPADPHVPAKRIDFLGGVLAVMALGLLAWALTGPEGEGGGPPAPHLVLFLLLAIVCCIGFLMAEWRAAEPIMPLGIFRNRMFSAANLVTFFLYFALSAVLFYLPMTLIGGWRLPEAQVGFVFLPLTIAIALMSGPVGKLADKTGPGPLIAVGSGIVGLAYAGLGLGIGLMSFWLHVLPMMIVMGIGMGLVVSPLSAAVMGALDDRDAGAASGINNAVSRVAGLVAVAAMGTLAALTYPQFGAELELSASDAQQHAIGNNAAFQTVAIVTALMCFSATVIAIFGIVGKRAKQL
jgi:EmrB/QacA subfamily drug resistance transporter